MYSHPEQVILFQNGTSDWRSSLMWDRCLPREKISRSNPLFLVRDFIRALKIDGTSE